MSKIDLVPASKNLSSLIEHVPDDALGEPTPCSEYCVGDLLDHIVGLTVAFGGAARKAEGESANMGPRGMFRTLTLIGEAQSRSASRVLPKPGLAPVHGRASRVLGDKSFLARSPGSFSLVSSRYTDGTWRAALMSPSRRTLRACRRSSHW